MNNFSTLEKIVSDTIRQIQQTSNFDVGNFLQKMEQEFRNLGFRTPTGGGGGSQSIERILILRLDAVGDFILLSPTIREIRSNYPAAFITLVVNKRVYQMAEFCPYVNEVIPLDLPFSSSALLGDIPYSMTSALNFSKEYFWDKHYDWCFTTLSDLFHVFMAYVSGARERVGYTYSEMKNDAGGIFFNHPVLPSEDAKHTVLKNLNILRGMGLNINSTHTEIWYSKEDFNKAQELLKDFEPNRIKIVVGIGANRPERRYPVEKYLEVFKNIVDKDATFLIMGGSAEMEDANFLQKNLPQKYVKNFAGLSWRVTAALIAQSDLYIGNDTGFVHIAAAANIPVIVLSRNSKDFVRKVALFHRLEHCEYYTFFPWQTKTIRLLPEHALEGCGDGCWAGKPHCITQIKSEEIIAAFEEMFYSIKLSKIQEIGTSTRNNSISELESNFVLKL